MALAYRLVSTQGNASGAALVVTKPTGTIDGDIIIVNAYLETNTNSWSGIGSGFTLLRSIINTGGYRMDTYWKRASGEPASWTWTPNTTGWRTISAASYSGNSGTGTPIDIDSGAFSATAILTGSQTAPTVTTTAANDLLLFLYNNFSGSNTTALTGAVTTWRSSLGGNTFGDTTKASAAATGTSNPTGMGSEIYAASHIALLLASSGVAADRSFGTEQNQPVQVYFPPHIIF